MDTETHEDPEMSAVEYENLVLTDRVYQLQLALLKARAEIDALSYELVYLKSDFNRLLGKYAPEDPRFDPDIN